MHFEVGDRVRVVHYGENDDTYAYVVSGSTGVVKNRIGSTSPSVYELDIDDVVMREDFNIESTGATSIDEFLRHAGFSERHLELIDSVFRDIEDNEFDAIFE